MSLSSFTKSDSTFMVYLQALLLQEASLTKSSHLEFPLHSLTKYLLTRFVCHTLCLVPGIYPLHKYSRHILYVSHYRRYIGVNKTKVPALRELII